MGRISQLREQANHTFSMIKTGSHQKRQYRKKAVLRFINTLYASGNVPINWYGLNKQHVLSVISYWQNHNLTDDSIRMYIAEIRYFLQAINHTILDIDNHSLGLSRSKIVQKKPFKEDFLLKISDQIVFLLIKLQIEFGLTLSESFRFTPDLHIRENYLLLSRDMTNSNSDRVVSIYNNSQLETVSLSQNLIDCNSNPIKQCGYSGIRERYRYEVKKAGLTPSVNYRHIFAIKRYQYLLLSHEINIAKDIIMQEMNVNHRTLRRYIYE